MSLGNSFERFSGSLLLLGLTGSPSTTLELGHDPGIDQRTLLTHEKADRRTITRCLNDLIDEVIRREDVQQCVFDLLDIVSTIDQLVNDVTVEEEQEMDLPSEDSIPASTNEAHVEEDEDLKVELPVSTAWADDVVQQPEPIKDDWNPLESIPSSSSDDLENSFDNLTALERPIRPSLEEPVQEAADLTALRDLISQIEEDVNGEDEEESFDMEDVPVLVPIHSEMITTESPDELSLVEDALPSRDSPLPEIQQESYEDFFLLLNKPSERLIVEDAKEEEAPIEPVPVIPVKREQFPVVHSHSLPSGTRIAHLSCSATHLYVCTTDQKIFYATLNLTALERPLQWQQHSELAQKLVVSLSNRAVWRLYNKCLYASQDAAKFPPIGSRWNEIKIEKGRSFLSISVNDQCGW